jgi:hypothetical protein
MAGKKINIIRGELIFGLICVAIIFVVFVLALYLQR